MQSEAKRRRIGRDNISWNSTADEFLAYEKKSLYAGGFIQGLEYSTNVLKTIPKQCADLDVEIEKLAKEIKMGKQS